MAAGARVASWKREEVDGLAELINRYPTVGVLDFSYLPAGQFQKMRRELRGRADIIVSKNTLLRISLGRAAERKDPKLKELASHLGGQSALILSRLNPFELSKILRDNRVRAPAKPGARATEDVVIPAGETNLPPGPMVGELQRAGFNARVQAGRVVVLEECRILKAGDVITKEKADVLAKFGIMPRELGLKLRAAYEGGMIFAEDVLAIDEGQVMEQLKSACAAAINLAINANYPTNSTVGIMISKAAAAARDLALNAYLPLPEVIRDLLAKANAQALSLAKAALTKDERALDERLKALLAAIPAGTWANPGGERQILS